MLNLYNCVVCSVGCGHVVQDLNLRSTNVFEHLELVVLFFFVGFCPHEMWDFTYKCF